MNFQRAALVAAWIMSSLFLSRNTSRAQTTVVLPDTSQVTTLSAGVSKLGAYVYAQARLCINPESIRVSNIVSLRDGDKVRVLIQARSDSSSSEFVLLRLVADGETVSLPKAKTAYQYIKIEAIDF